MNYNLTITRSEKNPLYIQQKNEYGYSRDEREPIQRLENIEKVLEVNLTEEQFNLMRKTVMEQWK